MKENDLLRSFEAYEKKKGSLEILDEGDTFLAALERIQRADALIGHKSLVAFGEFFRFLPGQSSIISAMRKNYPSVEILVSTLSCSQQEKIYDDVIKREISEIEKIADNEVVLPPKNFGEPRIRVMAARSPKQECRSLARIIMENPQEDAKRSDMVLCTRRSDSFTDDLMQETSEIIDDQNIPVNGNALSVPAMHSLLSPENIASWQESDTLKLRSEMQGFHIIDDVRRKLRGPGRSAQPKALCRQKPFCNSGIRARAGRSVRNMPHLLHRRNVQGRIHPATHVRTRLIPPQGGGYENISISECGI